MTKQKTPIIDFLITHGWAIIIILTAIIAFAYFGIIGTSNFKEHFKEQRFCSFEPDKCVCEEYIDCDSRSGRNKGDCFTVSFSDELKKLYGDTIEEEFGVECSKFRKKTQAELDTEDCQNNPREDKLCKCEEYKNTDKTIGGYACPNSCKEITVKDCKIKGLYHYGQEIEYEGRIIFGDQCELNPLPYDVTITDSKNITMQIIERNVTNCEQCYEYEQVCTKSRPKTDYEKHPDDYVVETQCVEYDYGWDKQGIIEFCGNNESLINLDFCPPLKDNKLLEKFRIEYCIKNQTSLRLKNECERGNTDWIEETNEYCDEVKYSDCYYTNGVKLCKDYCKNTINKTICRERTEVEKLMDKSCDWLFKQIVHWSANDYMGVNEEKELEPLKQAFKNKGCEI